MGICHHKCWSWRLFLDDISRASTDAKIPLWSSNRHRLCMQQLGVISTDIASDWLKNSNMKTGESRIDRKRETERERSTISLEKQQILCGPRRLGVEQLKNIRRNHMFFGNLRIRQPTSGGKIGVRSNFPLEKSVRENYYFIQRGSSPRASFKQVMNKVAVTSSNTKEKRCHPAIMINC